MGRFFQYEDSGTIAALAHKIEAGQLQICCVDSVDVESWYNENVHPAERGPRHELYDAYLRDEVVPCACALVPGRDDMGAFGLQLRRLSHRELRGAASRYGDESGLLLGRLRRVALHGRLLGRDRSRKLAREFHRGHG